MVSSGRTELGAMAEVHACADCEGRDLPMPWAVGHMSGHVRACPGRRCGAFDESVMVRALG